jgi:Putative MetA-pathway of phenol degradation
MAHFLRATAWLACWAMAMLSTWPTSARADAPAFDRPGIAFSPSVLPAGSFALEQGLPDFQRDDSDGIVDRSWTAGTTFRAGLTGAIELQIAGSLWNRSAVRAGGATTHDGGVGDTRFSIKWAPALPDEALSLAVLGSATADTGASAFTNGRPVYSLGATLGHKVGTDCAVALYANVDHSGGSDTWTVSPNFSFPIAGNLGGYVEAGRTTGGGESDSRAGGGLTWVLHDRVQLDLYALHGLTSGSTDLSAGFGVSVAWN